MTSPSGMGRPGWPLAALTLVAAATLAPLTVTAQREAPARAMPGRTLAARRPTAVPADVFNAAAASASGRIRIIVGLRVAYAMEAALDEADRVQQRLDIAAAQVDVERTLALFAPADVKRFTVVPGLAAEVDAAALGLLAADARVEYVELDAIERASLLQSTAVIGSNTANSVGYTGANQTIAVLDTGVDRGHPFLAGRVVGEACFSSTGAGFTSVCGAPSGPGSAAPCPLSDCDHGTHVAGIAAGSGTTFSGVAPSAAIMAVQVFTRFDDPAVCGSAQPCVAAFVSDQIKGLEHVYNSRQQFNIAAANMSLGGGAFTAVCDAQQASRKAIIDQLRSWRIATVVAAGNEGQRNALSAPACISTAVSVGSTNDGSDGAFPVDSVSSFSNAASFLTLFAPGYAITSSVPGGGFATFAGTSMAAPHVAGAFALYYSRFPQGSVVAALNAMTTSGTPVTDTRSGGSVTRPRLNVMAALGLAGESPSCSYTLTTNTTSFAATGSVLQVTVATQPGCSWQASSQSSFVQPSGAVTGAGPGSVFFNVLQNFVTSPRTGSVRVAGQTVTIAQLAALPVDMNRDGLSDLLWRHRGDGRVAAWLMTSGLRQSTGVAIDQVADTNWTIAGAGDLDGNGLLDIVWRHAVDGRVAYWTINGFVRQYGVSIGQVPDTQWHIRAVADMDLDGRADLIWQHEGTGEVAVWRMNGATVLEGKALTPDRVADLDWVIVGSGDFDRNGTRDLVWRHRVDGRNAVWLMNGTSQISGAALPALPDLNWQIRAIADLNSDLRPDLVWQHTGDGRIGVWLMNGTTMMSGELLTPSSVPDTNWEIVGPR